MHKKREPKQFYTKLGQVHFRLLCDNSAAGGLIGSAGTIVKALETATASKVVVGVSSADNLRLVSVFADHSLSRTIDVDGVDVRVSAAQEALVRVFDRLVEVDAECGGGGSVKCRLVVGPGMVGAVMGKGGVRISKVSRETQAYVKVLPLELPPSGADASDELILITGGSLPVRKALVVISQFIQQKAIEIERGAPESISSRFEDKSMKMGTSNSRVNNTANGAVTEVVFKLICPYRAAGFVIGFKGIKLKSIQDETRASIKFLEVDAGNRERVAVISAFELWPQLVEVISLLSAFFGSQLPYPGEKQPIQLPLSGCLSYLNTQHGATSFTTYEKEREDVNHLFRTHSSEDTVVS